MKRVPLFFVLCGFLILFAGCKKKEIDADGIRSCINTRLSGLKTINLGAMNMTVNNISVQGNQAQAQVEFRPKTGAPGGAGMQINYNLLKQNGTWVVQNSQPAGGSIQHPAAGENPHQTMTPGSTTQQLPNFGDLVGNPSGSSTPSGHPPVNAPASSNSQAPSYKP